MRFTTIPRLLLILLCMSAFAESGSNVPTTVSLHELTKIKKAGQLRVAFNPEDTPPLSYQDRGSRVGLDVTLAEAIAEKLGVKVTWVPSTQSFNGVFELLNQGKADIALSALFPTLDRLNKAIFSKPYLEVKEVLFVQRTNASKLKLSDRYDDLISRPDVTFGYFPDAGFVDGLLKRSIPAKWTTYEDTFAPPRPARSKMMDDFLRGHLTAVWIDELELTKWRKIKSDIDLYGFVVAIPRGEIPISVAVRSEYWDLLEWINLFIETSKRGDILNRIFRKHLELQKKVGAE